MRKYSIKKSLEHNKGDEYFMEFGVYNGSSANFISNHVKKLYAFDSFKGLKQDWGGHVSNKECAKGDFNTNKKIPKVNSNVELVVGWVEDTLETFLQKHNPKIKFVHMDMDTYDPTKFTLKKIKPFLVKGCIIIFDDFYNYIGWEYGEYKAFTEVFKENEFDYLAFNVSSSQVVIQVK